jgi:hypothetical protein
MVAGPPWKREGDAEDVGWALSAAEALWKGGDRAESLPWIRRAADSASSAGHDDRCVELARLAADLEAELQGETTDPEGPGARGSRDGLAPELALFGGFSDLPEPWREKLAARASMRPLAEGEELAGFETAAVLEGSVEVMAAVADEPAATVGAGELVHARGTFGSHVVLKLVASAGGAVVAWWVEPDVGPMLEACPWVGDELRAGSDRLQTLAAAMVGPLGQALDERMRREVMAGMHVRVLGPAEPIAARGAAAPGLAVVGVGSVLLEGDGGEARDRSAGDILFARELLEAEPVRASARAGEAGATLLFYYFRKSSHGATNFLHVTVLS